MPKGNKKETHEIQINDNDVAEILSRIEEGQQALSRHRYNQEPSEAVMVVGRTGAGKSTIVNYLMDPDNLEIINRGDERIKDFRIKLKRESNESPKIGHTKGSETTVPNIWYDRNNDTTYFDCPGFKDTKGSIDDIVNGFYIKKVFSSSNKSKILLVIPFEDLVSSKLDSIKEFLEIFSRLFINYGNEKFSTVKESLSLVVTKVKGKLIVDDVKKQMENILNEFKISDRESELAVELLQHIKNENKISLFKKPQEVGNLKEGKNAELFSDNNNIKSALNNCRPNNFEDVTITISDRSKNYINSLATKISNNVTEFLGNFCESHKMVFTSKFQQVKSGKDFSLVAAQEFMNSAKEFEKILADMLDSCENSDDKVSEFVQQLESKFGNFDNPSNIIDVLHKNISYVRFFELVQNKPFEDIQITAWINRFKNLKTNLSSEIEDCTKAIKAKLDEESKFIEPSIEKLKSSYSNINDGSNSEIQEPQLVEKIKYISSVEKITQDIKSKALDNVENLISSLNNLIDTEQDFFLTTELLKLTSDTQTTKYLNNWHNRLDLFWQVEKTKLCNEIKTFIIEKNKRIEEEVSQKLIEECRKELVDLSDLSSVVNLKDKITKLKDLSEILQSIPCTLPEFINSFVETYKQLTNKELSIDVQQYKNSIDNIFEYSSNILSYTPDIEIYDSKKLNENIRELLIDHIDILYNEEANKIAQTNIANALMQMGKLDLEIKKFFNEIRKIENTRKELLDSCNTVNDSIIQKANLEDVIGKIKEKLINNPLIEHNSFKEKCDSIIKEIENSVINLISLEKFNSNKNELENKISSIFAELHEDLNSQNEIILQRTEIRNCLEELSISIKDFFQTCSNRQESKDNLKEIGSRFEKFTEDLVNMINSDESEVKTTELAKFIDDFLKFEAKNSKVKQEYKDKILPKIELLRENEALIDSNINSKILQNLKEDINENVRWLNSIDQIFDSISLYSGRNKSDAEAYSQSSTANENFDMWMDASNLSSQKFKLDARKTVTIRKIWDTINASAVCEYEGNHGRVSGDFVRLSKIKDKILPNTKILEIFSKHTLIIDCDLNIPSANIVAISPKWVVEGNHTISLQGKNGIDQLPIQNAKFSFGKGKSGLPGKAGENGGNFYGYGKTFENISSLTINVSGGKGGKGQDGTKGSDGFVGEPATGRSEIGKDYSEKICKIYKGKICWIRGEGTPQEWSSPIDDFEVNKIDIYKGFSGTGGFDGGLGGSGGKGGNVGKVEIVDSRKQVLSEIKIIKNSEQGINGKPGQGGQGGKIGNCIMDFYGQSKVDHTATFITGTAIGKYGNDSEYNKCYKREQASSGKTPYFPANLDGIESPKPQEYFNYVASASSYKSMILESEREIKESKNVVLMIKGERAKDVIKALPFGGNGNQDQFDSNFAYDNFFEKYYNEGIDSLMSLRFKELLSTNDIEILPAKYIISKDPFDLIATNAEGIAELISNVKELLKNSDISTIIAPINIALKHWVGVAFKMDQAHKNLSVTYIDSENNSMPEELLSGLAMLNDLFDGIEIEQLQTHTQKQGNCGPELIENLMYFITGSRFKESEAVIKHSELLEQYLISNIDDQSLSPTADIELIGTEEVFK